MLQVVFRGGEGALQVLPPLIDVIPEARLNLVIYYLRQGVNAVPTQCITGYLTAWTPLLYIRLTFAGNWLSVSSQHQAITKCLPACRDMVTLEGKKDRIFEIDKQVNNSERHYFPSISFHSLILHFQMMYKRLITSSKTWFLWARGRRVSDSETRGRIVAVRTPADLWRVPEARRPTAASALRHIIIIT